MSQSHHEMRVDVPVRDTFLPGTLLVAQPNRRSKDVAILLHGQMAHQNQLYHKPLARALADKRQLDSFRFDFSHAKYNAPGWRWHMAEIQRDVDELRTVLEFLQRQYGYRIQLLIGHSKGALAAYAYVCTSTDPPPLFVNLSGRYDMKRASAIFGSRYYPAFQQQGHYEWNAKIAGQQVAVKVTPDQFDDFINYDTSFVKTRFPAHVHVLTLHGDQDPVVPVDDGHTYHSILSNRVGPGTSTLQIVQGAEHNYVGRFEEIVQHILYWVEKLDSSQKGHL